MRRQLLKSGLILLATLATGIISRGALEMANAPILSQIRSNVPTIPLGTDYANGGLQYNSGPLSPHPVLGTSTTASSSTPGGGSGGGASAGPSPLYTTGLQSIESSSGLAGQNAALGEKTSINDYLTSARIQQNALDNQSVQNYLAKQSGSQGILDWVGQGVRSGGVMLANKNATNSSAADALARAYSTLGRQQQAGVNQQFANSQDQVAQGRAALAADMKQHLADLPAWKTSTVNSIVSDAQQQLQQLNTNLTYAGLSDRVNLEAEKQKIAAHTVAALQGLDELMAGVNKIQPGAASDLQARANQLFQAGTAPAAPFNFSTSAPAQFQNTGPSPSELPLFVAPQSTKDQNQPAIG